MAAGYSNPGAGRQVAGGSRTFQLRGRWGYNQLLMQRDLLYGADGS